jgi:hypothetical protein
MKNPIVKRQPFYFAKVVLDGGALLAAFGIAVILKRGRFVIETKHRNYLILLLVCWLVTTLFSRKFFEVKDNLLSKILKPYFTSWIALTFLLTLMIYIQGWRELSRFVVYGTLFIFLAAELVLVSVSALAKRGRRRPVKITFEIVFMFLQPFFAATSFLTVHYAHYKRLSINDDYVLIFMGLLLVWMTASFATHRFKIDVAQKYLNAVYPFWKTQAAVTGFVSVVFFLFQMPQYSRTVVLGTLLLLTAIENALILGRFLAHRADESIEKQDRILRNPAQHDPGGDMSLSEPIHIEIQKYSPEGRSLNSIFLRSKLKVIYLNKYKKVFAFIERNLDLQKYDILKSIFIYSKDIINIELIEKGSLSYVMNFELINNIRRINEYFIAVNEKIEDGGVFLGRFECLEQRKNRIFSSYPVPLAKGLHFMDFLFNRVIPKLPCIRRLYFFFTKGNNRPISKTECLGRLNYCGFDVIALQDIDGLSYFIAKKTRKPREYPHPSYGLLIKQSRVGRYGKIVQVHKLRTMHPFSEYVHEMIYHINNLETTGKIRNDFRITVWGRAFRKKWLDELPMIINWLKGDVKLVGVRPLSETFFNTYPEDLRRERIRFKPGLIPPYYADMPDSIEAVWESERIYLTKYEKKPRRTDFVYFFKALNNILFHGAKSS